MKNNPLNGYQPENDNDRVVSQENNEADAAIKPTPNVEAIKAAANAARSANADNPTPPVFYPTCRFCGKQQLPVAPYNSQADVDEAATIRCDCAKAKEYQYELERRETREKNIAKLRQTLNDLSDYCATRGSELTDDLYNLLLNVGISVLDHITDTAALSFGRIKIKFSENNKGAIVIAISYSDGAKVEV